jgi:hypothetical protein
MLSKNVLLIYIVQHVDMFLVDLQSELRIHNIFFNVSLAVIFYSLIEVHISFRGKKVS